MRLRADSIKTAYTAHLPERYDEKLSAIFATWKRQAIDASNLKPGDSVIVFCCGTGNDFPHILDRIGDSGQILGIDFSPQMLSKATDKIHREGWHNVELVEADATEYQDIRCGHFDAGACTLGMSIIPAWRRAYYNLLSHVKSGGEVIIGDMQLRTGWRCLLNPWLVRLGKEFGGSHAGYKNCRRLFSLMEQELKNVRRQGMLRDGYCYCIGEKP